MPLLKLQTTIPVPEEKKAPLLKACSRMMADVTGKPEAYVMVLLEEAQGCLAGEVGAMAFADIRGIGGLTQEVNAALSSALCSYIQDELHLSGDKVYITFTDVPAQNWGWDSRTFG